MKQQIKVKDISLQDKEERLKEAIAQELAFKQKSEELEKKLTETTVTLHKAVVEREHMARKYSKKVEVMQKMEREVNTLKEVKEEVEKKMKG